MKRHRTHQIDGLARRVLRDALPPTWVVNGQQIDYGKDYLIEIGEDDGDLTGSSFYVQLKGTEKAIISADGAVVKYSLASKYATYYLDKIKDLPVFFVVVDVNQRKGWWLFLQPALEVDQKWRERGSITINLPASADIADTANFRIAVNEAKKWMRLHHPESIHESVIAHKERLTRTDPRFDVVVSLVNDNPQFTLLAKEEVPLTFHFTGDPNDIRKKVGELIDKGVLVTFQPGEVKVTGSKLFEDLEQTGGAIQARVDLPGTLTVVSRNADGGEMARLSDVPGRFVGGRKELWFEGAFLNSPLTIKVGPMAAGLGGTVLLNLNLRIWEGKPLNRLAYFDQLLEFFHTLPNASESHFTLYQDGNRVFDVASRIQSPFPEPLARYIGILSKARMVARRFNVNPVWTVEAFDQDTQETAEQLHAVFFENGWRGPMPNVRLTANCIRKTFRFDLAKKVAKPGLVRLESQCTYMFLGETLDVGRLVQEYTHMSIKVIDKRTPSQVRKGQGRGGKLIPRRTRQSSTVKMTLLGTKETEVQIRTMDASLSEHVDELSVLSEESNVTQS